jgi:hypothetical protein
MKHVGDVLSVLFDERLIKKAQGYSKIFDSWTDIAEKNGIAAAADHSKIKELDRGMLLIEADHPGWIQILQTKEQKILADFRLLFPNMNISGISLMLSRNRLDSETGTDKPPQNEKRKTAVSPPAPPLEPVQNQEHGYDAIKNGAFKESLKRLEQSIAEKEGV